MKYVVAACFMAGAAFIVGAGLAQMATASATEAFYLGQWKLTGAVVAPWADPKQKHDSAERSRLIGKTIVFKAKEITGPPPLACKTAHYKESEYSPNMIFQGAFEEMQSKNKSVVPGKLAASLGFAEGKIKTLETGCEIDFHFVDAATAEIGLNDAVYTLKKQ